MPTGPFKSLGKWQVYEHDGSKPTSGPSSKVTIVRATKKWIKYTRKDHAIDPMGTRMRHGKVHEGVYGVYRVSVGSYQHIEAAPGPNGRMDDSHLRLQRQAMRQEQSLMQERRRTMAARRIQRFLRQA
jgi:hypothetical protein